MSEHTKGPWNIHAAYADDKAMTTSDGEFQFRDLPIAQGEKVVAHANFWTATSGGFPRVDNEAEMLANARLIAAAPTLLAALQELVSRCDGEEGVRADGSNIQTYNAHAAIAAATGEPK